MPLRLNIPLPGPISYSTRVDGQGTSKALYWLCIGWWVVPAWLGMKWLTILMVLMLKWMFVGTAWLWVYAYVLVQGETRPPRITGWRIHRP